MDSEDLKFKKMCRRIDSYVYDRGWHSLDFDGHDDPVLAFVNDAEDRFQTCARIIFEFQGNSATAENSELIDLYTQAKRRILNVFHGYINQLRWLQFSIQVHSGLGSKREVDWWSQNRACKFGEEVVECTKLAVAVRVLITTEEYDLRKHFMEKLNEIEVNRHKQLTELCEKERLLTDPPDAFSDSFYDTRAPIFREQKKRLMELLCEFKNDRCQRGVLDLHAIGAAIAEISNSGNQEMPPN